MIGLILGTSEGKEILRKLNRFTDDLFVTTATSYGEELLKDYKYKYINSSPLTKAELEKKLTTYRVTTLIDASHPYATEITENTKKICKERNIHYIRYERPSVIKEYLKYKNVELIENLEDLKEILIKYGINGTILNTTGSKNVDKFINLKIPNRIVHRVLPTVESIEKCLNSGVKVEDIIAIKGPVGLELNTAFIKECRAVALILKDSGIAGGTEEKIIAAINEGILVFVVKRKDSSNSDTKFSDIDKLIEYIYEIDKIHFEREK